MLQRSKTPYRLLDRRGLTRGAYNDIHDGITLSSPRVYTQLPGLPPAAGGEYITVPEYRDYLARYVEKFELRAEKAVVSRIEREGASFRVALGEEGAVKAPAVVVATGMWDFPMIPPLLERAPAGIRWIHARDWHGAAAHPEERIVVVGAATGGIEICEEIAGSGRKVWVSARSGVKVQPQRPLGRDIHHWAKPLEWIPMWVASRYCDRRPTLPGADLGFSSLRAAGRIEVRAEIQRIDGDTALLVDGSRLGFDLIVAATGFAFRAEFVPREVKRATAGHLVAKHNESVSWPGLFVIGSPCAGHINSEFLRGIHRDAPSLADRIAARLG